MNENELYSSEVKKIIFLTVSGLIFLGELEIRQFLFVDPVSRAPAFVAQQMATLNTAREVIFIYVI